ncbi:hypothetical protein [Uliginosibacterium gangwonense]|nr:hypothetical protein [Uliginosibacterium gangwonense]
MRTNMTTFGTNFGAQAGIVGGGAFQSTSAHPHPVAGIRHA